MTRPRHVVLAGLMGSGKSTLGREVARRLGRPYVDNDEELERVFGRNAHAIAAADGLDALHRAESQSFLGTLAGDEPAVIGAPASVITDPEVRERLKDQFVVWLDTDLDTLARRFDARGHRPDIGGSPRDFLEQQYHERAPLYRDVASYVVRGHGVDPPERLVDGIVAAVAAAETGQGEARQ